MTDALLVLAQGAPETVSRIRWEAAPEAWQTFLLFALVTAFAGACYLLEGKDQRRWLRVPLAIVRAALIVLAIGMLFRPFQAEEKREVKNGFAVLAVDTSRSMGFEDRERDEDQRDLLAEALGVSGDRLRKMTRLERVKAALGKDKGQLLRDLAEKNQVRVFGFDQTRNRITDIEKLSEDGDEDGPDQVLRALADLDRVEAEGQSTALGDSMQRILTDLRSERVAALILLTDGRSNGGSLTPQAVAGRFQRKSVPIYAVGVGDPDPPRDLWVEDLLGPDVSLAGDVVEGTVVVKAKGYPEPREVRVRVELGDVQIAEETCRVGGDIAEAEVDFETKILRPGEYTIRATIAPDPDELTPKNNTRQHHLRVIDERIRVLYLEGYPRWEYRYLKNALVRDRQMEVQCLLFSADPGFAQEASPGIPSLTRLPSREELLKYHVIILGDLSPEARDRKGDPVFHEGALEAIKDLVKDGGGGLLMISGEQSAPRLYARTPLADVLPITIDETGPGGRDFSRPWRPRLTREGRDSKLLALERNDRLNRELWDSKLQDLYWYAQVERAKPQARVLAVHPRDRNQHGPYPLFAWHRYGAGTCFWLGIDETWRWRTEVGDKYPYRFYGEIIRFIGTQGLSRSKRFYITTDKPSYDVGEEVRIRAELRDPERLAEGAPEKQELVLDKPDGTDETLVLTGIEGEDGKYEGIYKPIQTGGYRLRVLPGERFGADEIASRDFEVKLPRLELQEPRMDLEGLQLIAEASGGRFLRLDELSELPEEIRSLQEPILIERTETELWDRPWVFILFFVLIVFEWIGRKLGRML